MLSRLKTFFSRHNLLPILVFLILLVCKQNYTPGTFLTGWDTLHPEFNYKIYWSRILGGVWQEHQGLGAVASQAHAGEIPRILILMVFDLLLKTSQIRYVYAFLMLLLGPVGVYFLLKYLFRDFGVFQREIGAFTGSLLYLFNLGTLQHFYVPLEMFLTHYGYLSWFYLFAIMFMHNRRRSDLFLFALISFLSAPQAHTSTLFYVHILCFCTFLFVGAVLQAVANKSLTFVGRSIVLIVVMVLTNFFWLAPNVYFALNHGKDVQNAKIHRLFSQEAFLQNKEFGNIKDVALMKNFLFNWGEHVGDGQYGALLDEWNVHLSNPIVMGVGYACFVLVLFGLILAILKRDLQLIPVSVVLFVTWFFLFNVNPPLGFIFRFFQTVLPLFKEAFRFPFTKFSILAVFSYSILFAYSIANLFGFTVRIFKAPSLKFLVFLLGVVVVTGSLIYYAKPYFEGGLISPSMRVGIPDRYFDMFKYFDGQEEYGRVAHFPMHTFWGWVYYDWEANKIGYQGAGFLWFGVKQPLLDREFDRWGVANEQYYREMSYAVYSEDVGLLEDVLQKYSVRWILLDKSTFLPDSDDRMLFHDQILDLFSSSEGIKLDKDFGDGLLVYRYVPNPEFERTTCWQNSYQQ
jgi:hypothetical protein